MLDASGVDPANAFLDNITVGGAAANWRCWGAMLRVIQIQARFGFMLNLCKYKFLVNSTPILGLEPCKQGHTLREKYI